MKYEHYLTVVRADGRAGDCPEPGEGSILSRLQRTQLCTWHMGRHEADDKPGCSATVAQVVSRGIAGRI